MEELGPRVDDVEHAHLLLRFGAEGEGAAAPEGGGEDLEGGAATKVWREVAANSSAPKKKERWSISSRGTMVFLVSAISSYSWCVRVTCGGSLAFRTSRPHTGGIDGAWAPRATSPTVVMNWTSPAASAMVWFSLSPNMNPPHFSLVTCQFSSTITLISISTNFKI